jgi:ribose transport system permease protein
MTAPSSSRSPSVPADTTGAPADPERRVGVAQRLMARPELMIFAALVVIIGVFVVLAPAAFLSTINLRNMAIEASMVLLLATGMTYVIITAGIDLSVGAVLVFSSACSLLVMRGIENEVWSAIVGLAVSLVTAGLWGLANGILVAKAKLNSLIVTLATMGIAMGGARLLAGGMDFTGVPDILVNGVGIGRVLGIPYLVLISLVVVVVAGIVLHGTRFGLYTFAIGSNEQGARRAGISVDRHLITVYVIAGLCAGLAGYLSLARFASTTISGHTTDNLKAITAVVLGGASLFGGSGSIYGTVAGVFIPVVLAAGLIIVGLPSFWQEVAVGIVLIAAILIDKARRRTITR